MRGFLFTFGVLISCLSAFGCTHDRSYFLSIDSAPSQEPLSAADPCTIYLGDVIDRVIADRNEATNGEHTNPLRFDVLRHPSTGNVWTIRSFEIKFEHALDLAIKRVGPSCQDHDKSRFRKWLATYALNGTDPDLDISRFEEYLESVKRISDLTKSHPIVAERNRTFEKDGIHKSQWCGRPNDTSCKAQDWQLYKLVSMINPHYAAAHRYGAHPLETVMLDRVDMAKNESDNEQEARPKRFYVLGYELPWDKQETEIRYGLTFYFEETEEVGRASSGDGSPLHFIGYRKIYANEATPQPAHVPVPSGISREDQLSEVRHQTIFGVIPKPIWYATGYPIALAIGVKNAAFEIAKTPFSWIGGIVGGRDSALKYPAENFLNAYKALYVEATSLPSYGLFTGLHQLLSEVPFVGQIFQLNTGPEHEDRDLSSPFVARKIFLSRGIYGGNEAGQDTGLWAAHAQRFYPLYDVYAPPYEHGTAIDVAWSMFNLSHGPGYGEAKYIMENAGPYDHLYLSGHSGGVQRSTSASRILANHGYSVMKVLGIAGPSVGQAYVDTRYGNPFQVFLNTQSGANQDVVGQIGQVASSFSTLMEYGVVIPLKFTAGVLTSPVPDLQRCTYQVFDHMGFSNAVVTEVPRKRTTLHQTPLRLSLNEPIVFDAYIRTEFETAFREDLMRPSDTSLPNVYGDVRDANTHRLLGKAVKSSKGCTLFEHKSGAVFEWYH
jgi:hypothetical protein